MAKARNSLKGNGSSQNLQQILANGHDLIDNNNFQGTDAGLENTGTDVNAFGYAAVNGNAGFNINGFGLASAAVNTGTNVNAFGYAAASLNTGDNVNAFGYYAGRVDDNTGNSFKNVNLFGYQAIADADNQTVFSKWVSGVTKFLGRLSFNNITANRKWELPDQDGMLTVLDVSSNFASDALAAAGGIPVGGLYHTAGVVKIRLT